MKCKCHNKEYCPNEYHEWMEILYDDDLEELVIYRVPIETWNRWEAAKNIGANI